MSEQRAQAIAALQRAKQEGLTYYQAVEALKAQGFTAALIDDASNAFDYQQGTARATPTPPQLPPGTDSDDYAAELLKVSKITKPGRQRNFGYLQPSAIGFLPIPARVRSWWYLVLLILIPLGYLIYLMNKSH